MSTFTTDHDIWQHYRIVCWAGRYADRWIVERRRDGRVMTEGSIVTCCSWVASWGRVRLG